MNVTLLSIDPFQSNGTWGKRNSRRQCSCLPSSATGHQKWQARAPDTTSAAICSNCFSHHNLGISQADVDMRRCSAALQTKTPQNYPSTNRNEIPFSTHSLLMQGPGTPGLPAQQMASPTVPPQPSQVRMLVMMMWAILNWKYKRHLPPTIVFFLLPSSRSIASLHSCISALTARTPGCVQSFVFFLY